MIYDQCNCIFKVISKRKDGCFSTNLETTLPGGLKNSILGPENVTTDAYAHSNDENSAWSFMCYFYLECVERCRTNSLLYNRGVERWEYTDLVDSPAVSSAGGSSRSLMSAIFDYIPAEIAKTLHIPCESVKSSCNMYSVNSTLSSSSSSDIVLFEHSRNRSQKSKAPDKLWNNTSVFRQTDERITIEHQVFLGGDHRIRKKVTSLLYQPHVPQFASETLADGRIDGRSTQKMRVQDEILVPAVEDSYDASMQASYGLLLKEVKRAGFAIYSCNFCKLRENQKFSDGRTIS